jgi:hypothetical protein
VEPMDGAVARKATMHVLPHLEDSYPVFAKFGVAAAVAPCIALDRNAGARRGCSTRAVVGNSQGHQGQQTASMAVYRFRGRALASSLEIEDHYDSGRAEVAARLLSKDSGLDLGRARQAGRYLVDVVADDPSEGGADSLEERGIVEAAIDRNRTRDNHTAQDSGMDEAAAAAVGVSAVP